MLHPLPHPHSKDTISLSLVNMEGSYHHPGVFPSSFPASSVYYPQPVVPAKREDDDVQFVSSNPVKKRRIDGYQPITPHSTTESIPVEQPAPIHQPPSPAKEIAQPERRGSTGMVDPSPAIHMPDVDPMRGCSMPTPGRSDYPESFWTAPSTGLQISPPVSPKSLPEHITPSMLRLDKNHGSTPGHLDGSNGAVVSLPGPAQPASTPANISPSPVRAEGTPSQLHSGNQNQTETVKDTIPVRTSPKPVGANNPAKNPSVFPAAPVADGKDGTQQYRAAGPISNHACPDTAVIQVAAGLVDNHRDINQAKLTGTETQPHAHQPIPAPSSLTSSVHATSHSTADSQPGTCSSRPALGAKGPCRQCMEARLRQKAANITAGTGPCSGTSAPTPSPASLSSTSIQQPWTHVLGINPYHNAMAGAMYGPLLQQPLVTGPTSHFAVPSQQSHLSPGGPPHLSGGHMFHIGSPPPMPQTQSYVIQQASRKPAKPVAAPPKAQMTRAPDTQSTTKHIIVDIADTCLDLFPFGEVAKRHNQPEQKVRDIFSAVIQVPLLRCPTDKRRAGKLGTSRVKEFNQAKKEAQAQANASPTRQDHPNQPLYIPSAWDIAQFMGSSDVQFGGFPQFSGPW